MDREHAMTVVLAEAFSETGLASLVENGADPGSERIDHLIEALTFLIDEWPAKIPSAVNLCLRCSCSGVVFPI